MFCLGSIHHNFCEKRHIQEYTTTTRKYRAQILDSNKSNVDVMHALRIGNVKNTTLKAKTLKPSPPLL